MCALVLVDVHSSKRSIHNRGIAVHFQNVLAAQNTAPSPGSPDNAAVILASPDFATWLDDEAFLADLLQQLPLSQQKDSNSNETSVLCAVVAALALPQSPKSVSGGPNERPPVSGLSIAYGNTDKLLPGIWQGDDSKAALRSSRGSIGSDLDKDAAVTVEVPPLAGAETDSTSLRVTLPLSNTIFQNGRRSTLLASLWTSGENGLQRQNQESRDQQLIVVPSPSQAVTNVSAPLFPLSEPLKIASGLGNIVRQVFDKETSKPIPAARELEAQIPALLKARRRASPALEDGALAVWGLVVPAQVVPFYEQLKQKLQSEQESSLDALSNDADHAPAAEQQAAAQASAYFTELLATGCRLHRILSGGGGWGLKQGLLSLDPQMSHPAAASLSSVESSSDSASQSHKILGEERRDEEMDDEAMLSFIRSFKNETLVGREVSEAEAAAGEASEGSGVDGVAMPGAFVQFFVAPLSVEGTKVEGETLKSADTGPEWSIALGAHAGYDGSPPILDSKTATTGEVALIHNHFGAVSNHGMYLSAVARSSNSNSGAPSTRTKLDAPNAYVWGSMHPR
ncbi:hypothetical protein Sste5344_006026 [Sporothrix stenoceras]